MITTSFDENVYVAVNNAIVGFNGADVAAGPVSNTHVPGAVGLVAADPVANVDNRGPTQCACRCQRSRTRRLVDHGREQFGVRDRRKVTGRQLHDLRRVRKSA
ncbi:MAG TPA: hypothetical protein VGZ52_12365, partial [Acidimicrobiales bacterium]|nr:hypothetical protein [Acidimicrobiales bacterium]